MFGTQIIDTDLSMFWAGYLLRWSDRNVFVPELATELPTTENGGISQDGLRFTYHLRPHVQWQDGAPFSADDVIYTWQQVMNPKNVGVTRSGYDLIADIAKLDAHTIVVRLKRRYAPFVSVFFAGSACVLPKHLLGRFQDINHVSYNRLPIGTGPYRVVANEDGRSIRLIANPHYWRGSPGLQEIDYNVVADDRTILQQLRVHKIDFYYDASAMQRSDLHEIAGTDVYMFPFTKFSDLGFNTGKSPLSSVVVRRALAYGLNKQALVDGATAGVDMPSDSDQPPFSWALAPDVERYAYNIDLAGRLLDKAGWRLRPGGGRYKDGKPLQLELVGIAGSATTSAAQRLVAGDWAKLDVRIRIANYSSDKLYGPVSQGGVEQSGAFDVAFEDYANGIDPDDSTLFACAMAPPAGLNIYHYCNRELDKAEADAISEYDRVARKKSYADVQQILAHELPILVVWFDRRQDAANSDLQNYKPAYALSPFWNSWQWRI